MSATVIPPRSFEELDNDLPSIASQAALELDHLALGRPIALVATRRLADLIGNAVTDVAEPVSPSSLLNPATAVALGKAIDEALHAGKATTIRVSDLVQQAAALKERLAAAVDNPDATPCAEKEALRKLCLALSRQASALESAARQSHRREHPFKKYL